MWIGLLTSGAHPGRPRAAEHAATLFSWGPRERARIDGPEWAVAGGVRTLWRTGTGPGRPTAGADPRCFTCREPYLIPDPATLRAREDIVELGARVPEDEEPDGGGADGAKGDDGALTPCGRAPLAAAGAAVFALVHVEDDRPPDDEVEALVYVPGMSVVSLIPLGCLGVLAATLREVGYPRHHCERCDTVAPGGSLAEPRRAVPRRARRRAA